MDPGILDEAYEHWRRTGPEFGPGLSNHGPMACEALVAMGRSDHVQRWSAWYLPRLREPATPRQPIDPASWREPLGRIERVGDWVALFDRELASATWPEVLERWMPRLAPGSMATHGVLRTAHAVRALETTQSPPRLHELAEGLAYWAARYQELPGSHVHSGTLTVADALGLVAPVPVARRRPALFTDAVRQVDDEDFAPVIDLVSSDAPFDVFVSDLTATFVREYLANANHASIAFIHTITAPSALRFIAPHVTPQTARMLMLYMWQSCAAMEAAFAMAPTRPPVFDAQAPIDELDLIDRAVAARDEHVVKFVEACLRENRLRPDPAFIAAAEDAVSRLRVPA